MYNNIEGMENLPNFIKEFFGESETVFCDECVIEVTGGCLSPLMCKTKNGD